MSRFAVGTGLLVNSLALAATVAVLAPVPEPVRAVAVLGFVLVGPGAALAGLLDIRSAATWATVTLGGSIAAGVGISTLAAIAGWWHPPAQIAALAVLSAATATATGWRSHSLTLHQEELQDSAQERGGPCTS